MTAALWLLGSALLLSLVVNFALMSVAIRLGSDLRDTERKLKASRQAHGMDVQALTAKMLKAQKAAGLR